MGVRCRSFLYDGIREQAAAATSLKCWLRREEIVVVLFAFLLFFFTPLFCGLFWERREDSSMGNLRPTKWLSCLIIYVLLLGQRGTTNMASKFTLLVPLQGSNPKPKSFHGETFVSTSWSVINFHKTSS